MIHEQPNEELNAVVKPDDRKNVEQPAMRLEVSFVETTEATPPDGHRFIGFEEARDFVSSLGIKTFDEWRRHRSPNP